MLCETEAGEAEVRWPRLDKGCELQQGCGTAICLVPASLGCVECHALEGGLWGVGWHGLCWPVRRLGYVGDAPVVDGPRQGVAGCACGAQPIGLGGLWPLGVPEAVEVVGLGHGVCKRLRRGAAALRVRFVTGSEPASENLALRLED